MLRLFVYGTLKRGMSNHARYCRGLAAAEPATLVGRLYQLPAGYPMLEVPEANVLALGTADYAADAARLDCAESLASALTPALSETQVRDAADWELIEGELLSFEDPARLAAIDELENFRPGQRSLYLRALVWCRTTQDMLTWTYLAPPTGLPAGAQRIGPSWP